MSVFKGVPRIDVDDRPIMRWQWRRGGGPANEIVMQGRYDELLEEAERLSDTFDAIDITRVKGTMFELRAAQQGDDVSEDHDVDGSNFTQSTLVNLNVRKTFTDAGLTDDGIYSEIVARISTEVSKFKSGQQSFSQMEDEVSTIMVEKGLETPEAFTAALDLAEDLSLNGDQFLQAQYVYRRTLVLAERIYRANFEGYAAIFADTHRIFTEAQMRDAENIAADIPLPPSVVDPSQSLEWLKCPTKSRVDRIKRIIVKEYMGADIWSRTRYAVKA